MGTLAGVLLCSLVRQVFDGPASLLFSCRCRTVGREKLWWWLHSLSSIALLPRLPGFLPQAFPTTISSLTSPPSVSLKSTAALTLGFLHNPLTPAPSCCAFRGTSAPVWGMYGCGKDCPFRLPQISYFSLSLKRFSSDSYNCPNVEMGPPLQFPHPLRTGLMLLTLLFFPLVPSSYRVLGCSRYSFPLVR